MGINAKLKVDLSPTMCSLFYLSRACNIDLSYLLMLYEKYDKDVFLFFFMLAGKKFAVPDETKLHTIFKDSGEVYDKLKGADIPLKKERDRKVFRELNDRLNSDGTLNF